MFDTTLGMTGARREARRTLATLPAALAVHGAALGVIVVGQLWAVEPVPQPDAVVTYVEVVPPPPAVQASSHGGGAARGGTPSPVRRPASEPAQPQVIPAHLPGARPLEPGGAVSTPGSVGQGEPGAAGDGSGDGSGDGLGLQPTGAASEEAPLRPGAGIVLPVSVERRDPVYPEVARKAGVEGVVIVEATIDRRGYVVETRVLRDPGLGCGAAVEAALRDWRYRPATLNGRPVSIIVTVTVNFRLAGRG